MPLLKDERLLHRLPESQSARLRALRDQMLADIHSATESFAGELAPDVERVVAKIKRGGYQERVIRREVSGLTRRHRGRLARVLSEQISSAAGFAERYQEQISSYVKDIATKPLPDALSSYQLRKGGASAEAAIAQEALLSRRSKRISKLFDGDEILRKNVKQWRKARKLSKALHGDAVAASREITAQTLAAVRESKSLSDASRALVEAIHKTGKGEIAKGGDIPRLLKEVQASGRKLATRGGPIEIEQWRRKRDELKRYARRLADGGRARKNVLAILQKTSDTSAKGIDATIRHYAKDKQRYAAERIVKTEQQAAYKARQIEYDRAHPSIVGYIWRMNRSARRGFVKRRTRRGGGVMGGRRYRRGGRRRRCVCESLDGKRLSVESVRGSNTRLIAHPHCMCWLEPVFDMALLR